MSPDDKLIDRLRRRPSETDVADIEQLLAQFGWLRARQKGSHVSFKKPGARTITLPLVHGRKIKGVYIDQIFRLLEIEK